MDKISGLLSGIVGGAVFVGFYLVLRASLITALVFGLMGCIGTLLLVSKKRETSSSSLLNGPGGELEGKDTKSLLDTLASGEKRVKEISSAGQKIKNQKVKAQIEDICSIAEKIFANLKKDPQDIKRAHKFLSYYLEVTSKIITKYVELSDQGLKSGEIERSLNKIDQLLSNIKSTFEKQLLNLLDDDILDLDTEITLLEKTMKLEGL
ncbi:MAG: 5-bromo-4-chloroindolyl phosphate hydrolysis family protein [bacterium]